MKIFNTILISLLSLVLNHSAFAQQPVTLQTQPGVRFPYYVNQLTALNIGNEFDDFGYPSLKLYIMTACLSVSGSSAPLSNKKFTVVTVKSRIQTETDNGGCLSWRDSLANDYWAPERLIRLTRTLTTQANGKNKSLKIRFYINPRDSSAPERLIVEQIPYP